MQRADNGLQADRHSQTDIDDDETQYDHEQRAPSLQRLKLIVADIERMTQARVADVSCTRNISMRHLCVSTQESSACEASTQMMTVDGACARAHARVSRARAAIDEFGDIVAGWSRAPACVRTVRTGAHIVHSRDCRIDCVVGAL